ncbi:MAG: two-component sensor histidine kinase [Comamonas sp.]|jgi:C4-dicarboxylate-specific signal transduction histidine kinase|uniref:sensor histidine kinase n=1 Tax=Comamonas sp. TaxID=34028 RepID=UPI00281AB810|nr:ATP-binding protein [Comamonas sp.]MDR0215985.1 two-component sensor histidine kinase [Comamonas sp.]
MLWLLVTALLLGLQLWQHRLQTQRQQTELAQTVQRQMLEKIAQHKAHLTALTALAPLQSAQNTDQPNALKRVAQSIATIYPRIESIDLITASRPASGSCGLPAAMQLAGTLAPTESASLPDTLHAGRYLLIKKIADPAGWICVRIDSAHLLDADSLPNGIQLRITLDGQTLLEPAAMQAPQVLGQFTLGGYGQPLQVQLLSSTQPWFSARMLWSSALLSLLLVGAGYLLWRSRQQAHAHQQQARLLANEARLAHAARINSLGEMASGIAHELAQPVTALLSQSQAALRAHELGKPALLATALQANVREARRAGDILGRMRGYISNAPSQLQALDLAQAVQQALLLLEGPARQAGIALHWQPPIQPCTVLADPVALEQVLHNLVRNALDALQQSATASPAITITLTEQARQILLSVQDNGPGMDAATALRAFEPFFTTKAEGMGLGLPLCATLMERMGSRLEYRPTANQGACFVMQLPRAPAEAGEGMTRQAHLEP